MVKLHIKRGEDSLFLYETVVTATVESVKDELVRIHNDKLRIERLCSEIEDLAKHGICLPPKMQGLTEEQIIELKLQDEWGETCIPYGGCIENKDPLGKRNGKAPNEKNAQILMKTVAEAKERMSKKQIEANICLTLDTVKDTLDILRGAVSIVYPMGLPPHDLVHEELESIRDGACAQEGKEALDPYGTDLWWAGKKLTSGDPSKKLADFVGRNEKTKIIVKLQKSNHGPPGREPVFTEEQKKEMMLDAYKRQEELKKLQGDSDDTYLESTWADNKSLQRAFHGLDNVSWRPK